MKIIVAIATAAEQNKRTYINLTMVVFSSNQVVAAEDHSIPPSVTVMMARVPKNNDQRACMVVSSLVSQVRGKVTVKVSAMAYALKANMNIPLTVVKRRGKATSSAPRKHFEPIKTNPDLGMRTSSNSNGLRSFSDCIVRVICVPRGSRRNRHLSALLFLTVSQVDKIDSTYKKMI